MLIRARVHPFPSRTRKLSSLLLTILGWRRPGKIGSANTKPTTNVVGFAFCFQSLSRVVWDIRFSTSCGTRQARWSLCANGDVRGNVKMGRGCLSGRCAGVIHSAAAWQHCTRSRCVMPRTGGAVRCYLQHGGVFICVLWGERRLEIMSVSGPFRCAPRAAGGRYWSRHTGRSPRCRSRSAGRRRWHFRCRTAFPE